MFSNSEAFPILLLPREIRSKIYQEIWAPVINHKKEKPNDNNLADNGCNRLAYDLEQAKEHLEVITTIKNLYDSCHQIRAELLTEPFFTRILPQTQVILGLPYPPPPPRSHLLRSGSLPNDISGFEHLVFTRHMIFQALQSSPAFTKHIQHVRILWDGCMCVNRTGPGTGHDRYRIRSPRFQSYYHNFAYGSLRAVGLEWLANKFQNIKTLEVVVSDAKIAYTREYACGHVAHFMPGPLVGTVVHHEFCQFCELQLVSMQSKTLEKVKFRMFVESHNPPMHGLEHNLNRFRQQWESQLVEWFWRARTTVMARVHQVPVRNVRMLFPSILFIYSMPKTPENS